jgi:hypothetical protein
MIPTHHIKRLLGGFAPQVEGSSVVRPLGKMPEPRPYRARRSDVYEDNGQPVSKDEAIKRRKRQHYIDNRLSILAKQKEQKEQKMRELRK